MMRARAGGTRGMDRARLASGLILALLASAGVAAAQAPSTKADDFEPVADVTSRYRFVERYAGPTTPAAVAVESGLLGQYRVTQRLTVRRSLDRPEGAPERAEATARSIYDERAAGSLVGTTVSNAVRRYEFIEQTTLPQPRRGVEPASRDGLTVWYQVRPGQAPRILSLVPGRELRSFEYQVARSQTFMPALAAVLPAVGVRVGDTWPVARPGIQAMAGEFAARADNLMGQLIQVRREKATGDLVATMALVTPQPAPAGSAVVNAEVHFRFRPPQAGSPDAGSARRGEEGLVEARGGIVEFRMGLSMSQTLAAPGGAAQLQRTDSREVVLTRDLVAPAAPLSLPERAPEPTEENSWLTYVDPESRFQFRHPQDLQPSPNSNPDALELIDASAGTPDVIQIMPSDSDIDPEALRKDIQADWEQKGLKSIPGPFGWLPEDEWPDQKVYRIEAAILAVVPGKAARRVTFDGYVVKFRQKSTLFVRAYTPRDPPLAFRRQVEDMIRTFRFEVPARAEAP